MDAWAVKDRLLRFEGWTDYMYRTSDGDVAIGAGHLILSLAAAQLMPWHGSPTSIGIAIDYDRVKSAPPGLAVESYAGLTRLRLGAETIESIMIGDVENCHATLVKAVPELESYPEPVQQALFDMAYSLGVTGLLKYKKLLAACREGDWQTAAVESRRHGRGMRGEVRNAEIEALFTSYGNVKTE
jgi:GH24 family phage-related lysozyme (muramidase)